MKTNRFKNTMLAILTALMLTMSAGVVAGDGSDPLDPSDGGADWDGDGLGSRSIHHQIYQLISSLTIHIFRLLGVEGKDQLVKLLILVNDTIFQTKGLDHVL